MKNIKLLIFTVTMAIIMVSCNQSTNKSEKSANDTTAFSGQEVKKDVTGQADKFSIALIITDYLSLKNALVSDDDKAAASAGKKLFATLNKVEMKDVPADKHMEYMDIADNAKENAEHIGDNVGNILPQREHLASLSEDIYDLIELFGSPQKLYQDHCPMFKDSKGAIWLSENKEIKNPYYGSKMISCGEIEETIDSK